MPAKTKPAAKKLADKKKAIVAPKPKAPKKVVTPVPPPVPEKRKRTPKVQSDAPMVAREKQPSKKTDTSAWVNPGTGEPVVVTPPKTVDLNDYEFLNDLTLRLSALPSVLKVSVVRAFGHVDAPAGIVVRGDYKTSGYPGSGAGRATYIGMDNASETIDAFVAKTIRIITEVATMVDAAAKEADLVVAQILQEGTILDDVADSLQPPTPVNIPTPVSAPTHERVLATIESCYPPVDSDGHELGIIEEALLPHANDPNFTKSRDQLIAEEFNTLAEDFTKFARAFQTRLADITARLAPGTDIPSFFR